MSIFLLKQIRIKAIQISPNQKETLSDFACLLILKKVLVIENKRKI
jgi:hypothetical protein